MNFNWDAIPKPLQSQVRWGVYNATTKEIGFQPGSRQRFKANDLSTAMSFNRAREYARKLGESEWGPMYFVGPDYIVLDFDHTEDPSTDPAVKAAQYKLMADMPTWTERSCSGLGYHAVYAAGARGSATTKLADIMVDVRGNNSLLFMTGHVVNDNGGMLSLAGEFVSQIVESSIDRKEFVKANINWLPEAEDDVTLMGRFKYERPEQFNFLCTGQDQSGIGDQRFAALKDLIVRSMNYEQIERIYLTAPCCHIDYISKQRGSTDRTEEGYKNFLRREIERAAQELIRSDEFNRMVKVGLECPTKPAAPERLATYTAEEFKFPPLSGIGAKAQASLDLIKGCSAELSLMSTLSLLAMACGRNYVTRGLAEKGLNNTLSYLQVDYFVVSGSGQGKSASVERLPLLNNYIPDNYHSIKAWFALDRFQAYVPKSISAQSLHNKILKRPDGVILHLDEIGMMLAAVSAMGGFEGYVNSINNAREAGGTLIPPEYSDSAKILLPIKDPACSIIATGVPSNVAIQIRANNRIESGYLARHLMMVLMEEDEGREVNLDGFEFDVVEAPVIELDPDFLNWLEIVTGTRTDPVIITWDPAVRPLLQRVFDVSRFDPHDSKTTPFNRYHEYTIKLSGLIAVLNNPHNPIHTVETLTWALEFTEAARRSAHAWFHRCIHTGTVRVAEREDIDTTALYERIHKLVSEIIKNKREGNDAHTKLIGYLTRQERHKMASCVTDNEAVPVTYLKLRKNSLGLSKAGSQLGTFLTKAIEEGVADKRLKLINVGGLAAVQALA